MIDGHRGQSAASDEQAAPVDDPVEGASGEPIEPTEPAVEQPAVKRLSFWRNIQLGKRLVRHGVSANQVTCVGVLLAAATGVCVGLGYFLVAIALLTTGGLMDTLDGVVAKAAGTASKKGAFFDSVADRVADGLIFGGVAWWFASRSDPKMALLPFAILGVSALISYERAKGESLGYDAKGGLMERAERLIFLGVALLVAVIVPASFVPMLSLLLALSCLTAIQRFVKVWRQASPELASAASGRAQWRRGRVESRWQSWREPRVAGARRRAATASRLRARRRDEPLGVRLRRVLVTERSPMRRTGSGAEGRSLVRSARRRPPGDR